MSELNFFTTTDALRKNVVVVLRWLWLFLASFRRW